jgi:hypothetical protein
VRVVPSADAKEKVHLPKSFRDPEYTLSFEPKEAGSSAKVAVDDATKGNTAIVGIPANDTIQLRASDFDRVHTVHVDVTYQGKPLQAAKVTLKGGDGTAQVKGVEPGNKGRATFQDVSAGKCKLTLVYGDNLTETRDVEVLTDHAEKELVLSAAVTNAAPTLDAPANGIPVVPATSPSTSTQPQSTVPGLPGTQQVAPSGGGFAGLLGNLIGLAIVAGLIYALYRWAQSGGMGSTLKKWGIETAGPVPATDAGTPWAPNQPAAPVIADPTKCQFCGQTRDAAGNCACTLAAGANGAVGMPVAAPGAPSQPRLVGTMGVYSGTIFPIVANGSGIIVGRDPANAISLSNDTTVSRRHASLRTDGSGVAVVDEGSSNGIYVNGVRISGTQTLSPGDEVQIGNTRFRFEV